MLEIYYGRRYASAIKFVRDMQIGDFNEATVSSHTKRAAILVVEHLRNITGRHSTHCPKACVMQMKFVPAECFLSRYNILVAFTLLVI